MPLMPILLPMLQPGRCTYYTAPSGADVICFFDKETGLAAEEGIGNVLQDVLNG